MLLIGGTATAPVEEWDPSTGLWKDAGSLAIPRHANASATLLQDGRVLVTGGLGDDRHVLAAVEVYAPRKKSVRRATVPARRLLSAFSTAGSWRKTGSLAVARFEHSATLLADGRVLVAGGVHRPDARHPGEALTSAEIWDPKSETWSATGDLAEHRRFHRAVLLPDGQVLLVGGFASAYYSRNTTEALIFNPSTATFAGAGRMTEARFDHTATVLPDGRVLVAGGKKGTEGRDHLATAEIWDRGNWTMAASLSASHAKHTALLLRNRDVLVLGGGTFVNIPGVGFRGAPAELWDTDTGTWRKVPDHRALQNITAAGALPDGRVLVVRSVDSDGRTSVEIGDPLSGTWRETDSLLNPKHEAIACFFPDGRLMLDEEIWDPVKEAWQSTPHMLHHRRSHTATALPDGRVLVTGGVGTGGADPANRTLSDCEVWEP